MLREAPHVLPSGSTRTTCCSRSSLIVERESLADLVGCVGNGRARVERGLARMEAEARHRFALIEGTIDDVERHQYRADAVKPAHVLGSVAGWSLTFGVSFWWCGSPATAAATGLRLFGIVRARMLKVRRETGRAAIGTNPHAQLRVRQLCRAHDEASGTNPTEAPCVYVS